MSLSFGLEKRPRDAVILFPVSAGEGGDEELIQTGLDVLGEERGQHVRRSKSSGELGPGQHPASGLAGQLDEAEVPVERGRSGRFGIDDDGRHRKSLAGGSNALARIGEQDGAQDANRVPSPSGISFPGGPNYRRTSRSPRCRDSH